MRISRVKCAKTIRREKARNANHIHYEKLNSFENVSIEKLLEKMPLPPKTFFSKNYTIDDNLMERTFRLSQKSPLKLNDKNVSSNTDKIAIQSSITKDVSINNFQQDVSNKVDAGNAHLKLFN
uniref:Uncharacterized protein n=1 Tax=Parastrongyloides trichosuri TaxID=131310 RepID=A0A0N5A002_PARTI